MAGLLDLINQRRASLPQLDTRPLPSGIPQQGPMYEDLPVPQNETSDEQLQGLVRPTVTSTFKAGMEQTSSSIKNAVAGAAQAIGATDLSQRMRTSAGVDDAAADRYMRESNAVGSLKDVNNFSDLGNFLGHSVIRNAPQLGVMAAGAALTRGRSALGQTLGTAAPSAVMNFGATYGEGMKEATTPDQQQQVLQNSAVVAPIMAALDSAGFGAIFKTGFGRQGIIKAVTSSLPAHVRHSILTEGLTEAAQEYVQKTAVQHALGNPEAFGLSEEEAWRLADAAAAGGAAGGAFAPVGHIGGMAGAAGRVIDKYAIDPTVNALGSMRERAGTALEGAKNATPAAWPQQFGSWIAGAVDSVGTGDATQYAAQAKNYLFNLPGVGAALKSGEDFFGELGKSTRIQKALNFWDKQATAFDRGWQDFKQGFGEGYDDSQLQILKGRYKELVAAAMPGRGDPHDGGKALGELLTAFNNELRASDELMKAFGQGVLDNISVPVAPTVPKPSDFTQEGAYDAGQAAAGVANNIPNAIQGFANTAQAPGLADIAKTAVEPVLTGEAGTAAGEAAGAAVTMADKMITKAAQGVTDAVAGGGAGLKEAVAELVKATGIDPTPMTPPEVKEVVKIFRTQNPKFNPFKKSSKDSVEPGFLRVRDKLVFTEFRDYIDQITHGKFENDINYVAQSLWKVASDRRNWDTWIQPGNPGAAVAQHFGLTPKELTTAVYSFTGERGDELEVQAAYRAARRGLDFETDRTAHQPGNADYSTDSTVKLRETPELARFTDKSDEGLKEDTLDEIQASESGDTHIVNDPGADFMTKFEKMLLTPEQKQAGYLGNKHVILERTNVDRNGVRSAPIRTAHEVNFSNVSNVGQEDVATESREYGQGLRRKARAWYNGIAEMFNPVEGVDPTDPEAKIEYRVLPATRYDFDNPALAASGGTARTSKGGVPFSDNKPNAPRHAELVPHETGLWEKDREEGKNWFKRDTIIGKKGKKENLLFGELLDGLRGDRWGFLGKLDSFLDAIDRQTAMLQKGISEARVKGAENAANAEVGAKAATALGTLTPEELARSFSPDRRRNDAARQRGMKGNLVGEKAAKYIRGLANMDPDKMTDHFFGPDPDGTRDRNTDATQKALVAGIIFKSKAWAESTESLAGVEEMWDLMFLVPQARKMITEFIERASLANDIAMLDPEVYTESEQARPQKVADRSFEFIEDPAARAALAKEVGAMTEKEMGTDEGFQKYYDLVGSTLRAAWIDVADFQVRQHDIGPSGPVDVVAPLVSIQLMRREVLNSAKGVIKQTLDKTFADRYEKAATHEQDTSPDGQLEASAPGEDHIINGEKIQQSRRPTQITNRITEPKDEQEWDEKTGGFVRKMTHEGILAGSDVARDGTDDHVRRLQEVAKYGIGKEERNEARRKLEALGWPVVPAAPDGRASTYTADRPVPGAKQYGPDGKTVARIIQSLPTGYLERLITDMASSTPRIYEQAIEKFDELGYLFGSVPDKAGVRQFDKLDEHGEMEPNVTDHGTGLYRNYNWVDREVEQSEKSKAKRINNTIKELEKRIAESKSDTGRGIMQRRLDHLEALKGGYAYAEAQTKQYPYMDPKHEAQTTIPMPNSVTENMTINVPDSNEQAEARIAELKALQADPGYASNWAEQDRIYDAAEIRALEKWLKAGGVKPDVPDKDKIRMAEEARIKKGVSDAMTTLRTAGKGPDKPLRARPGVNAAPGVAAQGPKARSGDVKSSKMGAGESLDLKTKEGQAKAIEIINKMAHDYDIRFVDSSEIDGDAGQTDRTGRIIWLASNVVGALGTAYHETFHAVFKDIAPDDKRELIRSIEHNPAVKNKLLELLKHSPEAQDQVRSDTEEAAAYAFQFWKLGLLPELHPKASSWFQKFHDYLAKVWQWVRGQANAEEIFERIANGMYANGPDAAAEAIMRLDRTKGLAQQTINAAAQGFEKLHDIVLSSYDDRLRDTGISALNKLAQHLYVQVGERLTERGLSQGMEQYTKKLHNEMHRIFGDNPDAVSEALRSMAQNREAKTHEAKLIREKLFGANGDGGFMHRMHVYQKAAGMKSLGKIPNFIPMSWSGTKIGEKRADFIAMMKRHQPDLDALNKELEAAAGKGNDFRPLTAEMIADVMSKRNQDKDVLGIHDTLDADGLPVANHVYDRVFNFLSNAEREPFTKSDLVASMGRYVTQAVRRAEYVRRFGERGEVWKDLMSQAKSEGATADQLELAQGALEDLYGTRYAKMNPVTRQIMSAVQTYQNYRVLGLCLLSSQMDPLLLGIRTGEMGESWNAYKAGVKALFGGDADYTEIAKEIGATEEHMVSSTLYNRYGGYDSTGLTRKLNDLLFTTTGMNAWTHGLRTYAVGAGMRFIDRNMKLGKEGERHLKELGLAAGDIHYRKNGDIAILDAHFTELGLDLSHAEKIQSALNRFVDESVLTPNSMERPRWGSDPHLGLLFHLKQFMFTFQKVVNQKLMHEFDETGSPEAFLLAAPIVPVMALTGYTRDLITHLGAIPEDRGFMYYAFRGLERSGFQGPEDIPFDMLQSAYQGQNPLAGQVGGPSLDQAFDAVQAIANPSGPNGIKKFVRDMLPFSSVTKHMG
jgi:hypothetical protein